MQSSSNTVAPTPKAKQIKLTIVLNIIEEGFGSFRIVDTLTPHLHAFVCTEKAKLEIDGQANIQVAFPANQQVPLEFSVGIKQTITRSALLFSQMQSNNSDT